MNFHLTLTVTHEIDILINPILQMKQGQQWVKQHAQDYTVTKEQGWDKKLRLSPKPTPLRQHL